jgi:hypothetical protein
MRSRIPFGHDVPKFTAVERNHRYFVMIILGIVITYSEASNRSPLKDGKRKISKVLFAFSNDYFDVV